MDSKKKNLHNATRYKIPPLLGHIYKSCILHATMTEQSFEMSCINHTMTNIPKDRVQKTPHMMLHTGYASQKTTSDFHIEPWNT